MKKLLINIVKKYFIIIIIIQQALILYYIFFSNIFYISHLTQNLINIFSQDNKKLIIELKDIKLDYNNQFAILSRFSCPNCGLFSFYIVHLGCIREFLIKGYIPIIDVESFSNIFNGFNKSSLSINPWELFFYQPFNFTLKDVKRKAKNIKYFECKSSFNRPNYNNFLLNEVLINYWHNIANIYMPIKKEIINESNNIINNLFKNSKNILGVLTRGTDYLSRKPKYHPIPPDYKMVIQDIKKMDSQNNYDYIFLATEDDIIREKIINAFNQKIKIYKFKENIKYNYKTKNLLGYNNIIRGNIEFIKIYIINIIILSKCIDIISARTSGSIGVFILTQGFRNIKIYYLGNYK